MNYNSSSIAICKKTMLLNKCKHILRYVAAARTAVLCSAGRSSSLLTSNDRQMLLQCMTERNHSSNYRACMQCSCHECQNSFTATCELQEFGERRDSAEGGGCFTAEHKVLVSWCLLGRQTAVRTCCTSSDHTTQLHLCTSGPALAAKARLKAKPNALPESLLASAFIHRDA